MTLLRFVLTLPGIRSRLLRETRVSGFSSLRSLTLLQGRGPVAVPTFRAGGVAVHRFSPAVLVVLAVFLLTISGGLQIQSSVPLGGSVQADHKIAGQVDERTGIAAKFSHLPLGFERNQGQTDGQVQFLARGHGYTLFLTGDEAVLELGKTGSVPSTAAAAVKSNRSASGLVRMRLVAASAGVKAAGLDELPGKSNYFIGNDRSKWRSSVPNYARVKYQNVYPGIDLVYYGSQGQLEYDFVVAPGADPGAITLEVAGQSFEPSKEQSLRIDSTGALVTGTGAGEVRFHKPVIYQTGDDTGQRIIIGGHYRLFAGNRVGFEIPAYDKTKTLVIDPVLSYSSFLGGSAGDAINSVNVTFDSSGNAYVASGTTSLDFPVTAGAAQSTFGGAPAPPAASSRSATLVSSINRRFHPTRQYSGHSRPRLPPSVAVPQRRLGQAQRGRHRYHLFHLPRGKRHGLCLRLGCR